MIKEGCPHGVLLLLLLLLSYSSVLVREPSPTQNRLLTERNGLIGHVSCNNM